MGSFPTRNEDNVRIINRLYSALTSESVCGPCFVGMNHQTVETELLHNFADPHWPHIRGASQASVYSVIESLKPRRYAFGPGPVVTPHIGNGCLDSARRLA